MTADPFARIRETHGSVVLDGGLATELERRGADLKDPLWSAKVLVEDPDAIRRVHEAYFVAGADVAISASYQATFEGLAGRGIDRDDAAKLMRRSVELAREAAGGDRVVAASVGPYGAMLGNGAEYTGDYDKDEDELAGFHMPRLRRSPRPGRTCSPSRRSPRSSRRERSSAPSSGCPRSPHG